MKIRKFQPEADLAKLETFLRNQYLANKNMSSWLPERLHDLVYRMGAQEADNGSERSMDYIYLLEEQGDIIAAILPDGENIYMSIKTGFEELYGSMVAFSETHCLPLFSKAADGSGKFWVAANDSLTYMQEHLLSAGYSRYADEDYDNYVYPQEGAFSVDLPAGFRLLYGDNYPDEDLKWSALGLGFHPDREAPGYRNGMNPYHARKNSSLYPDSFECLVVDENALEENDVCAYCFVYVDAQTKTALIEPVSTREKYQRRGIGTALMHGAILKCKEKGVEKCYVNSFSWRRKFYNSASFITEDTVGFWYKKIRGSQDSHSQDNTGTNW